MLIIPAIDLKGDNCVRLRQGNMDKETVFSNDPITMVDRWVQTGAQRLHVVDLDGAHHGRPVHAETIVEITRRFPKLVVEAGGGIRDEDTVQFYLDAGVQFVVLGTRAVTQPHFVKDLCLEFPGHIIVGLDMRDGKVATSGWSKMTHHDVVDMAKHFESDGVSAIIFTDIARDGMLNGINVGFTQKVAAAVNIPVIAAGGVSSLDDIKAVCRVQDEGIIGVIVGRALYDGIIDLKEAQQLADSYNDESSHAAGQAHHSMS